MLFEVMMMIISNKLILVEMSDNLSKYEQAQVKAANAI